MHRLKWVSWVHSTSVSTKTPELFPTRKFQLLLEWTLDFFVRLSRTGQTCRPLQSNLCLSLTIHTFNSFVAVCALQHEYSYHSLFKEESVHLRTYLYLQLPVYPWITVVIHQDRYFVHERHRKQGKTPLVPVFHEQHVFEVCFVFWSLQSLEKLGFFVACRDGGQLCRKH